MGFIKLLDKKKVDIHHPYGVPIALVECDICGEKYEKLYYNLKFGCTCRKCGDKKAGAKRTTHGESQTRLYEIWKGIKARCYNPKIRGYKNYGGRGIKCLRKSYEDFKNDMGDSYSLHVIKYGEENTSIDRIDVNGNYCKENCRWATRLEQSNNNRMNKHVIYKGRKYTSLAALCKSMQVKYSRVYCRIYTHGWEIEDAIDRPLCHKGRTL